MSTDEIQALSKQRGRFKVRASKGVHVVVPTGPDRQRRRDDPAHREIGDVHHSVGSFAWIIGTTDTDWNLDLAHPAATKADIDYILDHRQRGAGHAVDGRRHRRRLCRAAPVARGGGWTTRPSCRASTRWRVPAAGLVAIAGGKYTTYRVMAADAIDAAAEFIPARVAPSITEKVPLMGAEGYFALVNQTENVGSLQGLDTYRVRHLLDRYGSLIGGVLGMAVDNPDLLDPPSRMPRAT